MKLTINKTFGLFAAMALCVVFFSCASFSFSGIKPCSVPEDFFGISPDRFPWADEGFDLLDDYSATWIRTTIRWSRVEPEEGVWDFDVWDNYLAKAEEAGKRVIFILGFDNKWLYKNNKEHRDLSDRELPYFLKYVEQVVSRYGTRVVYEIWNEPNVIYWDGPNKRFFALSAAAAKKIREVESEAVILAGSTWRVSKRFTRGLFNAGAMENVDGFSVHPYSFTPKATIKQYNKLQKILDEFDFNKPVWITELGYFTGPRPFFNTKSLPEYIVKTMGSLSARAGEIRNMIWYELMNNYNPEEKRTLNPLKHMGLIYPNRTLKPGAEAFMLASPYLAGTEYHPELPLREAGAGNITSLYFTKEDGTSVLILWKNRAGKQIVRLSVPEAVNITRHSIYNRETTFLSGEPVLELSREPVFITWQEGAAPVLSGGKK